MTVSIAIVGMACRYPDAGSPAELWESVLAQRRAFRRIPDERLRLADYFSADPEAPDCLYSTNAALIEGYEFDRRRFRVAGSTFRAADHSHWLALMLPLRPSRMRDSQTAKVCLAKPLESFWATH